jgi:hypothetical protein
MVIFPSDYGHRPYDFCTRSDLKHWSRARQAPTPEGFAGIHHSPRGRPWWFPRLFMEGFNKNEAQKKPPRSDQKEKTHIVTLWWDLVWLKRMIVVHQAECRFWGKLGGFHPPCRARPLRLRCRDYLRLATARPNKDVVSCGEDGWIILVGMYLTMIWRFPNIGVPPNHPIQSDFPWNKASSFWGTPSLGNPHWTVWDIKTFRHLNSLFAMVALKKKVFQIQLIHVILPKTICLPSGNLT